MSRRVYFLLQKDFQELRENNYKGITAFPVSEDMMAWEAAIEGLQNTVWHGIVFHLAIKFTLEYNLAPPVVTFRTIPFHPNVDQHTGRPCIDFLDNPHKWSPSFTLSSVLLALQVMLSNPVLENPVNLEAAQILINDASLYRLIIRRLHKSFQLNDDSPELSKDSDKFIRSIKISFDDYYRTWRGIATSKPEGWFRAPVLKDPNFIREHSKWKDAELKHHKVWNLKLAAALVQYARESKRPYATDDKTRRTCPCPTPNPQAEAEIAEKADERETGRRDEDPDGTDESWENEAEELAAWTSTLDTHALED